MDDLIRQAERLGPGQLAGEPEIMGAYIQHLERAGLLKLSLEGLPDSDLIYAALQRAADFHGTPRANSVSWLWGRWSSSEGYGQEEVWALGRDENGQWIVVEGGCDTTGWDCQSGASCIVQPSLAAAVAALSQETRVALLNHLNS